MLSDRLNTLEIEHRRQTSGWASEVVMVIPNQWRDPPLQWAIAKP